MKSFHRLSLLSSLLLFATPTMAVDVIKTWTGAANNALNNVNNWNGNTRPTFPATANTDALIFGGAGTGIINANVDATAKSITISGALGYTFQGVEAIRLGDTFTGTTQPNTGFFINNSSANVNIINTGGLRFSFGKLEAAVSTISIGSASFLDIGNGAATAGRNLTIAGGFDITVDGPIQGLGTQTSAGGHLFKDGAGTLNLRGGSAAWQGRIFINNGSLRINNSGSLGSANGDTSLAGGASTGKLEITNNIVVSDPLFVGGRAASASAITNISGNNVIQSPVKLQTGGIEYALESTAGSLTLSGEVSYGDAVGATNLTLRGAGTGTINGAIGTGGNAISIIKTGSGRWSLNGNNAFTGSVTVSEGRLNISTGPSSLGAVTLTNGAQLGIRIAGAGQTLNTTSTSLEGTTGTALALDLDTAGNPSVPVLTAPVFTVTGSVGVAVKAIGLSAGQIPLFEYSGTIGGTGFAGLSLSELPARVSASLVDDTVNTRVLLNVTAVDRPRWTGEIDANWDANDGTGTGTANWREVGSGLITRYLQGTLGNDAVLFDDSATGPTTVVLTTELTPASVIVDNSTKEYVFTGGGNLAGAGTLTKKGTGTLVLLNGANNTYTGTTTIEAGTVRIGDGVLALSGSLGVGPVTNNGSIILNRPDSYTLPGNISGTGSITKLTPGIATLSGNSDFSGQVNVDAGTLRLGNGRALGATTGGTVIANGAALDLGGQLVPEGEVITVSGTGIDGTGAVLNTGVGNSGVGLRKLVLTGPTALGGTARWDIRDVTGGLEVNGHALTKTGTNSVFLANLGETGIGNLSINGATSQLAFEGNTTLGSQPGTVTVASGSRLGFKDNTAVNTKPIILDGGSIEISGGDTNTLASLVTLQSSSTVIAGAGSEFIISGKITGAGGLTKTTGGILKITNSANDYAGTTTISAGPLWIGNDGPTGLLPLTDIINSGNLIIRRTGDPLVLSQNISGSGQITIGINNVNVGDANYSTTLSGTNTFTGAVTINRGRVRITNSTALGTGTKVIAVQTANQPSLILDGSAGNIALSPTLTFNTSSETAGAIINIAGDNVINGLINVRNGGGGNTRIKSDGGSLTLAGNIIAAPDATSARTVFLDGTATGNIITGQIRNGVGTPSASPPIPPQNIVINKQGTGTWILTNTNTYLGNTTVTAGTLKLGPAASIATSPIIDVLAGAFFDVADVTGGFALANNQSIRGDGTVQGAVGVPLGGTINPGTGNVAGTLSFANNLSLSGGRVLVNFNSPTTTSTEVNDLINVGGDLAIAAPSVIELSPTGAPLTGSYRLFNYTGALTGDTATLSFINPTRYLLSLDTTTPGQVNLLVGGSVANLTWAGNGTTNVWDNTTPASWNTGSETFFQTDAVLFDDSSANTNVTLAGSLLPLSVTVASAQNYTFTGTGGIAGYTGLTKTGTGVLTLDTVNSFTGKVKISGGSVVLGVNGRLTGTRWIEVDQGALLDVQAVVAGFTLGGITDQRVISGRGTLNGNYTVNSAGVIKPGDSLTPTDILSAGDGIGRLSFGGNLTLATNALPGSPRLVLRLAGPTATVTNPLDTPSVEAFGSTVPTQHDSVGVGGIFALDTGSTIRIELADGYTPANGDVFNIADWTTLSLDANADTNAFDPALATNLELPALPVGLFWNRSLFSTQGILFISPEPPVVGAIQIAPGDTVNPGVQVTLSTNVTGLQPYGFQWRRNNSDILGATNPTFVFTAAEADQGTYTVVVTNPAGPTTSAPAVFTVNDPVLITTPPQSRTLNPGSNVTFSVSATGSGSLSYQWRKNTVNIDGATNSSLVLTNITELDQASYDVVVTNIVGSTPSLAATLTVNDPVSIAQEPQLQGALVNQSATFTVVAGGTGPFTYQWRKGSVNIPNSNSPSLTLSNLTLEDAGLYSVVVSNAFSNAPSKEARLVVANGTPVVATLSASRIVAVGATNLSLQVLAFGTPPLKYQWYRNNTKIKDATSATHTIPLVALTHAGTYKVEVTSTATVSSGNTELAVVQRTPSSQILGAGTSARIEVKAEGVGLSYVWDKDGAPITPDGTRIKGLDNKKILEIRPLKAEDTGDYTLTITGPGGSLTSGLHELTIFSEAPEITENPPAFPAAIVSGTFSYQIPVNPDPKKTPTSFTATGLPPGLVIDTKTGRIAGKPTAVSRDPLGYLVKLTASNGPRSKSEVSGRLLVQAFPPNAIGSFVAPIGRGPLSGELGGLFELTTTITGTQTGRLTLGTLSFPLRGVLDATPNSSLVTGRVDIPRKAPLTTLVLTFTLDAATNRISAAQVTDGTSPLTFTGWRNKWTRTDSAITVFSAYHTFALDIAPALVSNPAVPQGNGFGSFTIAADGRVAIAGKLADGESLTGTALLGPDGQLAIFRVLYATVLKGSIAGSFDLDPQTLSAALTWSRPQNLAVSNRTYRAGFPEVLSLTAKGGRYTIPTATQVFLNVAPGSAATLGLAEGGIEIAAPSPDIALTIAARSRPVLPVNAAVNPRRPTLTLTDRTGAIQGGFALEDANPIPAGKPAIIRRAVTFEGIAVPDGSTRRAYGFFLLPQLPSVGTPTNTAILSGQVILEPAAITP